MLHTAVVEVQGNQQLAEALKLSSSQLQGDFLVAEALPQSDSPPTVKFSGSPVVHRNEVRQFRDARPRKQSFVLSVAAAIPILAFLVVWSACTAAYIRERAPESARRRLADSGDGVDEVEDSILEDCLALEADLGISKAVESSHSSSDRSRRIAELVSLFSEAAAAREWAQETQTTCSEAFSGLSFPQQIQEQPRETPTGEQNPQMQGEVEYLSASGDLVQASANEDEGGGRLPVLDPDAWLEKIPDITAVGIQQDEGGAPWDGGCSNSHDEELLNLAAFSHPAANNSQSPAHSFQQPAHKDGDADVDATLRGHPFVRLPLLGEGVVPNSFDMSVLSPCHRRKFRQLNIILPALREQFMVPVLNQQGANRLVRTLEDLAYSLLLRARVRSMYAKSPLDLPTLGKYFLAFDFLVAGSQALGENLHLDLWWDRFVAAFDLQNIPKPELPRNIRHCTVVQRVLANRLVAAMRTYKQGKRPPLKEVIELKRLLLCSPYTHRRFKDRSFDPWREDENLPLTRGQQPR